MIYVVDGKPGAGKGRAFAWVVADMLRRSNLHIVVSFATRLHPWINGNGKAQRGLIACLKAEYGTDFNAEKRVHFLPPDCGREFYLWRVNEAGELFRLPVTSSRLDKKKSEEIIMEFDSKAAHETAGLCYMIDEAGIEFSSRNWASCGDGLIFYSSQHRHLGDDCYFASQNYKDIDVMLQRKTQHFWRCRNRSFLRFLFWKLPSDFKIYVYENPPTGAKGEVPQYTMTFKNKGSDWLFETFDTSAGIGLLESKAADVGKKTKGWPWWTFFAGTATLAIGVLFLLHYSQVALTKKGRDILKSEKYNAQAAIGGVKHSMFSVPETRTNMAADLPAPVVCTGVFLGFKEAMAFLSDGRTVSDGRGLTRIMYNRVEVGTNWYMRQDAAVSKASDTTQSSSHGQTFYQPPDQNGFSAAATYYNRETPAQQVFYSTRPAPSVSVGPTLHPRSGSASVYSYDSQNVSRSSGQKLESYVGN